MGCHFLLQGIFPNQGSSPALAGGFFTAEPPGKPGKAGGTAKGKHSKHVSIHVLACLGVEGLVSGGAVSPQ